MLNAEATDQCVNKNEISNPECAIMMIVESICSLSYELVYLGKTAVNAMNVEEAYSSLLSCHLAAYGSSGLMVLDQVGNTTRVDAVQCSVDPYPQVTIPSFIQYFKRNFILYTYCTVTCACSAGFC